MSRLHRRSLLLVLLLLTGLAVAVAACGGGNKQAATDQPSGATAPPPPSTSAPPSPSESSSAPPPADTRTATSGMETGAGEVQLSMVATDEGGRFRFEPSVVEVQPGQRVTLTVVNRGVSAHDLSISAVSAETGQLNPGEEKSISFVAPSEPGEYEFLCTVPGHAQLGMTGKLIVKR